MNHNDNFHTLTRDEWMERHWPKKIGPIPTEAQWYAAKLKWEEACAKNPEDQSDYCFNFSFTVATYAPFTWAHHFGIKVDPPNFKLNWTCVNFSDRDGAIMLCPIRTQTQYYCAIILLTTKSHRSDQGSLGTALAW